MNVKKRVFTLALVIALAAAGVLISGSHNVAKAGPGAAPVSIASPLPLPITGTATVSGTVGATQSGTWNVGITGQPVNVNVANSPAVSLVGTPTVNIGGSTGALPTQDLSTFVSQNVLLQNRATINTSVGLFALSSTGTASNCCYAVPVGQTLVVTSFDITPVTPGPGTNHITLAGSLGGAAEAFFRSFEVSNTSGTHLDYPTGIAFGSNERIFIFNGIFQPGAAGSAGDVDIYLQGYLTSN